MAVTQPETHSVPMTMIAWRQLGVVALGGVAVGVFTFILGLILNKYVFMPIGCQTGSDLVQCQSVGIVSHNVALLLGAGAGLSLLVRSGVFRPLLAILGIVAALWSVVPMLPLANWPIAILLAGLMFGLSYSLFVWLVQLRRFWVAVVLVVIMVVLLRLVLHA